METIKSLLVSPSFWVSLIATTIGGIFVIRGLIMENDVTRKSQGERLVITGVCIEVIGAALVTVIAGIEVVTSQTKLKSVEKQAALANELTARIGTTNAQLVASNFFLQKSVFNLAHEYDLTTNALAEANARLLSVSKATEANSPRNLPIRIASGYCVIGISKNTASLVLGTARWTPFIQLLQDTDSQSGIGIVGRLQYVETNRAGDVILTIDFNGEKGKSPGAWGTVTFNNLSSVRLDLASTSEPPFEVEGGFLRLNTDSLFDSEFAFQKQTNRTEFPFGIIGRRRISWQ